MAATKLQLNPSSVVFQPSGGNNTTITKITSVSIDYGGTLLPFSGDNDRFPTTIVNAMNQPRVSVTGGDIAALQAYAAGQIGTLYVTHADAKAAANGAIVYTCINCVVENMPSQAPHQQFGTATLSMLLYSSDGSTHPISFTRS